MVKFSSLLLMLALSALIVFWLPAQTAHASPVEIIIDLQDGVSSDDTSGLRSAQDAIEAWLIGWGFSSTTRLNSVHAVQNRLLIADVDAGNVSRVLAALRSHLLVEHAELNLVLNRLPENEPQSWDVIPTKGPIGGLPNDPMWDRQWSFRMIGAEEAWKSSTGKGVVVAVIDTGVAFENYEEFKRVEDLAGVEFVKPYDFVNDTAHPNDDHGHGTHVAGTIAQATNNQLGVAGIAYGAKIMPIKVLSAFGGGSTADIADAIRYAADEGANVINMSLGGGPPSNILATAVDYAHKKGVIVVCAAGNNGRETVEYPAAYPGAFAVSSVGPDKKLAPYSSYGKQIALSAPGGDKTQGGDAGAILQNTINPTRPSITSSYMAFQGTSMAAPHVAAVAALLFGTGLNDKEQIEAILKQTAEDAGATGWDPKYGAGIVNAQAAVAAALAARAGEPCCIAAAPVCNWWCSVKKLVLFLLSSPFPIYVLTILLVGLKWLRKILLGLTAIYTVGLSVWAFTGFSDVPFIPGVHGFWDVVWLMMGVGLLSWLVVTLGKMLKNDP